jgi:hypothetical protein
MVSSLRCWRLYKNRPIAKSKTATDPMTIPAIAPFDIPFFEDPTPAAAEGGDVGEGAEALDETI